MSKIPQATFHFIVKIGGQQIGFQDVSGLESELETEEISEGGENAYKHRLPKSVKYNNLVLKKGYISKDNELVDWFSQSANDIFESGPILKPILIHLLDEKGEETISWNVVNAYPVKWSMSNLNSQTSEIAIETIELAYQSFTVE